MSITHINIISGWMATTLERRMGIKHFPIDFKYGIIPHCALVWQLSKYIFFISRARFSYVVSWLEFLELIMFFTDRVTIN